MRIIIQNQDQNRFNQLCQNKQNHHKNIIDNKNIENINKIMKVIIRIKNKKKWMNINNNNKIMNNMINNNIHNNSNTINKAVWCHNKV